MGVVSPLPPDKFAPFVIAACFGAGAAALWTAYFQQVGLIASIDAKGVQGKYKFVSWQSIESCEITLIYNLFGNLKIPFFVFKDCNGRVLLNIEALALPEHQNRHFESVIECYLSGN